MVGWRQPTALHGLLFNFGEAWKNCKSIPKFEYLWDGDLIWEAFGSILCQWGPFASNTFLIILMGSLNNSSQLRQGQKTMGYLTEIGGVGRGIACWNHMRAWWKITGSFVVWLTVIYGNNNNNNKHLYRANSMWICSNARNKQILYKLNIEG